MAAAQVIKNISKSLESRISSAVQFAAVHSTYPSFISVGELTTAQSLVLSLFHSLLQGDVEAVLSFLPMTAYLPQLQSTFIAVWLRDDYHFRQEDVAKVLSVLAQFIQDKGPIVPPAILMALTGLEEKYDIFNFYYQSGDTTAKELLAYLNPLITRATQAGPQEIKDQGVLAIAKMNTVSTQTDDVQNLERPSTQGWQQDLSTNWIRPISQHPVSQPYQQPVSHNLYPSVAQSVQRCPGHTPYSGTWPHPFLSTSRTTCCTRTWPRFQPAAISGPFSFTGTWPHPGAAVYNSRRWNQPLRQSGSWPASGTHRPPLVMPVTVRWSTENPWSMWPQTWRTSNPSNTGHQSGQLMGPPVYYESSTSHQPDPSVSR